MIPNRTSMSSKIKRCHCSAKKKENPSNANTPLSSTNNNEVLLT